MTPNKKLKQNNGIRNHFKKNGIKVWYRDFYEMKKQLLFSFFIIFSFVGYAQEKWDYPIKPKTEEWKKLESNKTKVEACQVPEYILRDISTNDLMTLCLQYPLLYDVFAFNNTTDGLRKLFSDFNGIREFSKRESLK